jgi:hypothetical protein
MRQLIIHMLCFTLAGFALAEGGLLIDTWNYWAIMLSMGVVHLNA